MTAELRRGLVLACVGLLGGFALIVALFGPAELTKRARSVVGPSDTPSATGDPGKAEGQRAESPTDAPSRLAARSEPNTAEKPASPTPAGGQSKPAQPGSSLADEPALDIVRVEPNGDAVIAGRGAPNATIEVLRGDTPIARAVADPAGQFAIVPPTLPTGNSELTIRMTGPDGKETRGKESVVVVVAENRTTKPLVAVSTPDKPTNVLSQPDPVTASKDTKPEAGKPQAEKPPQEMSALAPATKPGDKPAEAMPVKIVSVDAQEGGRLDVTGRATAWSTLRLYLNDTLVAAGQAGPDGRIAFTIGRGVKAGGYQIRVDQVDAKTGKVEHRAQVAFAMPDAAAGKVARAEPTGPAQGGQPAPQPLPAKPETSGQSVGDLATTRAPGSPSAPAVEGRAPNSGAQGAGTGSPHATGKPPAITRPEAPAGSDARPRTAPETPAVAAGTGKPDSPGPSPEADRRAAEALAPALPKSAKPDAPASLAETPSTALPAVPSATSAKNAMAGGTERDVPVSGAAAASAPTTQPGTVFVAEINTARITRGDNLWQISRRAYGSGLRYTVIYDANQDQIRDPDLIYPGQIFVLPKDMPAADGQGARRG